MILLPIWLGASLLIVSFWALAGLLLGQHEPAPEPTERLCETLAPRGEAA